MSRDNDKNPVVSLREIADETIKISDLKESMIASLQTQLVDYETSDIENEEDEAVTEEDKVVEPVNPLGKFGIQVQDRYEDI